MDFRMFVRLKEANIRNSIDNFSTENIKKISYVKAGTFLVKVSYKNLFVNSFSFHLPLLLKVVYKNLIECDDELYFVGVSTSIEACYVKN